MIEQLLLPVPEQTGPTNLLLPVNHRFGSVSHLCCIAHIKYPLIVGLIVASIRPETTPGYAWEVSTQALIV